jgi:undecaprenyl-diphosphatase
VTFPVAVQVFDEGVLRATRDAPSALVYLFVVLTFIGGGWGLLALLPYAFRSGTRSAVFWLLACELTMNGTVSLLKLAFGRPRPCDSLGWCPAVVVNSPGGFSFPSGHAAGAFAFSIFIAVLRPNLAPYALVLAALVAFSRCILAVHYPTDVAAGAVVGTLLGVGFAKGYLRWSSAAPVSAS